jgi:hypothetical protein
MSSSSGNAPRGLGQSGSGNNASATALGNNQATPQTLTTPQGQNTITWKLTGGLKWAPNGIVINGGWPFTQPSLQGNNYQLSYDNNASSTQSFTYSVNVTTDAGGMVTDSGSTGGNDPVIENQGGGGSGPGRENPHRFDPKSD